MEFYLCPFLQTYNRTGRHAEHSALLLINIRGNAPVFQELDWTEAGRRMAEKSHAEQVWAGRCSVCFCLTCICSVFINSALTVSVGQIGWQSQIHRLVEDGCGLIPHP